MNRQLRRLLRASAAAVAPLALAAAPVAGAAAQDGEESIAGVLDDGTGYGFVVPPSWNGTLVIDPDFVRAPGTLPGTDTGLNAWLLDAGYAVGGTSRVPTMDRVQESVAAMMGGLDHFDDEFGAADVTVVKGGSLGGFTSRAAIELHPERLDGALAMCGGGAGLVGGWNQKLDAAVVAQALIAPDSDLELVNITDSGAATSAWNVLIDDAAATPEGRARLALASAVGQVPITGDDRNQPLPAADDFDDQLDRQIAVFQLFVRPQIRATVEGAAGGNISWNHGVDYARQLADSGLSDVVEYHYAQAGLDLAADLAELAALPRISADPGAVAWAEDNVVYSGDTGDRPVLAIHTAGDRSESLSFDAAYAETFREAGTPGLLRQAWVERAGHCSFTELERLTALLTLLDRVETGTWPSTDATALNARADQLTADGAALGVADYFTPEITDFLRPWDGRHAGSYEVPGEYVTVSGVLHEGTPGQVVYEAIRPPEWNGTFILDLDFNSWRPDRREFFLEQGYAIGGNQRTQNETAYELKDYVDNLLRTRELLIEAIEATGDTDAEPQRTIAWGNSRGGFVARMAAQYRPDIFDGALGSAGGGAGVIGSWLGKADSVWALQELVDPDAGLAINNLPDIAPGASYGPNYDQDVKLNALVDTARSSDEGMARLMLASAFAQQTEFPSGDLPPAADDYRTQGELIAGTYAFGHPQFVHKEIEVMGGGPVVWNHDVDYRDLLERSGALERVTWWYENAGLDLEADLDQLAAAPRYSADPAAVAVVEGIGTYDGTGSPVLTIKSRGDAADSPSLDEAYVRTFEASGNGDSLLRALMINRSGHGGQTFGEHLAAFEVLEERLDTGEWPDVSPEAMNARVAELAERFPLEVVRSAEGRYMPFDDVAPALRTWDFTNWGTYQPEGNVPDLEPTTPEPEPTEPGAEPTEPEPEPTTPGPDSSDDGAGRLPATGAPVMVAALSVLVLLALGGAMTRVRLRQD